MDFEEDIKKCITVLQSGGIIVYPTDTIWGIGCDATNEQAVEKVFALKNRPHNKSMIILLPDAKDILQYVAAPPPDIIDIVGNFTEPVTVVYDGALDLAENAINEDGSIGIRVTNDLFCKALLKRFRKPLISTSANLSGQPSPAFFSEIANEVVSGADYVVEYRREDNEKRQPSRIARVNDEGELTYIR